MLTLFGRDSRTERDSSGGSRNTWVSTAPPGSDDPAEWKQVVGDAPGADVVLLDDANLGFRDRPDLWPAAIAADAPPSWILVKMARPVAKGKLWDHLQEHHADRLVAIIPVNDLRRTEVHISRGLSWERTAQSRGCGRRATRVR